MLEPRPEIRTATRFLAMRSPIKTEAFRDRRYRHRHPRLGRAKLRFVGSTLRLPPSPSTPALAKVRSNDAPSRRLRTWESVTVQWLDRGYTDWRMAACDDR